MNSRHVVTTTLIAMVLSTPVACGGERIPPRALQAARGDFAQAQQGIAMRVDPADVHEAEVALQRAERAWHDSPDDPSTVDLAIIADRRALLAQSQAGVIEAGQQEQQARAKLDAARAAQLESARNRLGVTEQQLQQTQASAAAEEQKLRDMQDRLQKARETIAKIATVKEDPRGMVIELQGDVLFKTGKFDLKPAAMAKLDQIADALRGKDQPILVLGYTDDVGTPDHNLSLSLSRAQAVRDYLASKGIPQDLLKAEGKGQEDPVSDNTSIEGRSQNRRVEIVVQPKP
jgi:outer membrane protein OmpA-like peptidoglycan-associated protein